MQNPIRQAFSFATAPAALSMMLVATAVQSQHHEQAEHEYHNNYLALFVGVTSEDRRDSAATVGLEYERRLSETFGVGALIEHAYGDLDFTVYAVPFAYHAGPWKLYAAPGIEDSEHHHGNEFLFRLGVEYGFAVGRYEVAPQFDIDFVEIDTGGGNSILLSGVSIGDLDNGDFLI